MTPDWERRNKIRCTSDWWRNGHLLGKVFRHIPLVTLHGDITLFLLDCSARNMIALSFTHQEHSHRPCVTLYGDLTLFFLDYNVRNSLWNHKECIVIHIRNTHHNLLCEYCESCVFFSSVSLNIFPTHLSNAFVSKPNTCRRDVCFYIANTILFALISDRDRFSVPQTLLK